MSEKRDTKAWAQGRWKYVLSNWLTEEHLSGKHTSCPMCGGKDRFRFDNKEGRGTWFCSQCGAGDGWDLFMKVTEQSFADAAKTIDEMRGEDIPKETFREQADVADRRRYLNRIWSEAKDREVVTDYFGSWRGFKATTANIIGTSPDLRGHPKLWHTDDEKHYPAVLAMVRDVAGRPVTIHRTYLKDPKPDKRLAPGTTKITGAGIRLITGGGQAMVVAEGMETAAAGWQIVSEVTSVKPLDCCATISAHGMETLEVPDWVVRVFICADNDESFTGQAAAFALAKRLKSKGLNCSILMPKTTGQDVDDIKDGKAADLLYVF